MTDLRAEAEERAREWLERDALRIMEFLENERDDWTNADREFDLARVIGEALADRDLEWFQIIESFAGFHPVSMTDALNRGIEWAQREKAKGSGACGTGSQS